MQTVQTVQKLMPTSNNDRDENLESLMMIIGEGKEVIRKMS